MTAFAGPRPAVRVARPRFSTVRESLQGFRGAVRSATAPRGDYADALLIGRG
jgi:hypothetical protein